MVNQGFWEKYKKLIKDVVLDYQYLVMLDEADIKIETEREDASLPSERSQAITNLKIAAGLMEGEHYGWWFQDTDVYKWIETAAYTLENFDDEALKTRVDSVIDIIKQAQDEDGYLSTYYQLRAPHLKYKELDRSHELYNAGHLIEAAVAYAKATGNETLLEVSKRYVDHIMAHFGVGKIEGADGHQEIELALIKLYKYTNDEKYLDLSRYFIDVRGKDPLFYNKQKEALGQDPFTNLDYLQAYDQPIHQKEAKGHAVRVLYMMEAMADLALHQNDQAMEDAVMTLWDDIVKRKMYVTGGVGQTVHGESFADGYELPNDTMYCETCAAIGMVNTAQRLFKLKPDNRFIDVLERALYNGMLAGMSQDGKHFYYVNPLEYIKDRYTPDKGHVKGQRPEWLGCACCPPNISRTIASIDSYFYTRIENEFYIHMYADAHYEDEDIKVTQLSNFPKSVDNTFEITIKKGSFNLRFRKPQWAKYIKVRLNGTVVDNVIWLAEGTYTITTEMDYEPLTLYTNGNVVHNSNKVAFQYGPFVYCGESIDQKEAIYKYRVNPTTIFKQWHNDALGRRYNLEVGARYVVTQDSLYSNEPEALEASSALNLIPYYLWANRAHTDMMVWLPIDKES